MLHMTVEALESEGRFDIVERGLSNEDREHIANMSADEFRGHVSALREHFAVSELVSRAGEHSRPDLAEKAATFMGDVTRTWVDAQCREERADVDAAGREYDERDRAIEQERQSVTKEMRERERRMADIAAGRMEDDGSRAVWNECIARLNSEALSKRDLNRDLRETAKKFTEKRAAAIHELLGEVGTESVTPYGSVTGQKKLLTELVTRSSTYYPDSWKAATESLGTLNIRYSTARAHYSAGSPVRETRYLSYENKDVEYAIHEIPTVMHVESRRRRLKYEPGDIVDILVGGDPSNPQHVAELERACEHLNAEDEAWKKEHADRLRRDEKSRSKPRWEVYTNSAGHLAMRETFPSGKRISGFENVIKSNKDPATMTHELAHRMEDGNPHLRELCMEFIRRRTTNEDGVQETPTRYHRDKQPVYKDDFINAYSGKVYSKKHTEVLSTGMEMVFHGDLGAGIGAGTPISKTHDKTYDKLAEGTSRLKSDEDHVNFILGLLMSADTVEQYRARNRRVERTEGDDDE